jgi:uncharacterized protein (DUF3820 family)
MNKSQLREMNNTSLNNNAIPMKKLQPFRRSDGRLLVGRYKGQSLKDVPRSYITWMLNNIELDSSSISYLRNEKLI